ncbi:hypothetical protein D3C85_1501650 [compost metagenome]
MDGGVIPFVLFRHTVLQPHSGYEIDNKHKDQIAYYSGSDQGEPGFLSGLKQTKSAQAEERRYNQQKEKYSNEHLHGNIRNIRDRHGSLHSASTSFRLVQ